MPKRPTKPIVDEAAIMITAIPVGDGSVDFNIDLGYNMEGYSALYAKAVIELVTNNREEMFRLMDKYLKSDKEVPDDRLPDGYLLN